MSILKFLYVAGEAPFVETGEIWPTFGAVASLQFVVVNHSLRSSSSCSLSG
jgi:hypothetical protein